MTPSEQARYSQFEHRATYPRVDNWQDSKLSNGNIVYVWEADGQTSHGNGDVFAMTPDTALGCHGDPNKLQNDLQTAINPEYDTHRGHLQAYEMTGDVEAAYSHCEANKCHGSGGGEQYFIPDFDNQCSTDRIVRRDDLNLDFNKEVLPISQEQKYANQDAVKAQQPEFSPIPSKDTFPTLDGAYQGSTLNKAEELKPQVDAAQKEWNNITPSESTSSNNNIPKKINSQNIESINGGGARAPTYPQSGTLPQQTSTPTEIPLSGEKPYQPLTESAPTHSHEASGTLPGKAEDISQSDINPNNSVLEGMTDGISKKNSESFGSAVSVV